MTFPKNKSRAAPTKASLVKSAKNPALQALVESAIAAAPIAAKASANAAKTKQPSKSKSLTKPTGAKVIRTKPYLEANKVTRAPKGMPNEIPVKGLVNPGLIRPGDLSRVTGAVGAGNGGGVGGFAPYSPPAQQQPQPDTPTAEQAITLMPLRDLKREFLAKRDDALHRADQKVAIEERITAEHKRLQERMLALQQEIEDHGLYAEQDLLSCQRALTAAQRVAIEARSAYQEALMKEADAADAIRVAPEGVDLVGEPTDDDHSNGTWNNF